ncbi:THUMP-like domain-containing protein [Rothia sp. P5766]|uniref:class I SAM-dependent methyltransferase n=1 Tax=Rothia sp. P5766 TaxID=3402656 RepID=UPI003AEBAA54
MPSLTPAPAHPFTHEQLAAIDEFTPYSTDRALAAASTLRSRGFSPEDSSAILTQAKLRTQGADKFGDKAHSMLLTEAGYEQATRAAVAKGHAQRFKDAGITSVADLGCGIGADSLAFTAAGLAITAVELDPATAAFTAHNLAHYPNSQVLVGNVENINVQTLTTANGQAIQALWLDPARREVEGGATTSRLFDPEAFSPPLSLIEKLAATGMPMGVKMGPGLPHEHIPANCEAEWVSHGGSVVEVVLWFNALARKRVRRAASLLSKNPQEPELLEDITSALDSPESTGTHQYEPTIGELATYLAEPDGAVVRSHLVSDLAHKLGAHLIDERIAYLTTDTLEPTALAQYFEVRQILPLHEKALKRWVKENGITALTVKKRGVDIVPEQLRAKLLAGAKKKKGQARKEATLILTRLGQGLDSQRLAIWAEPVQVPLTKGGR